MNGGEIPSPAPAGGSIEKVERSALKSGESDSVLSQKPKSTDTFDDLRKESPKSESIGGKGEIETKKEDTAQAKWDKVKSEIENTADADGYGIDEGIKDLVIALNVFGINTDHSCEGHDFDKTSAPWIRIKTPNEPEEMFIGQSESFERVAKKYNIPLEEAKTQSNTVANKEAMEGYKLNGVTKDFQKWEEESAKLLYITKEVLDDFYQDRQVPDNIKIKVDTEILEDMTQGSFEIFNGGDDYRNIDGIELTEEERESLAKRLSEYRKEMQAFADFLKEKFFSEGESYVNGKKKLAQEKIDQEKIKKIQENI